MSAVPGYLSYPRRKRGSDHDRYEWSNSFERPGLSLPGGKTVALMVVAAIEWFPLDMPRTPVLPTGALDGPYSDTWQYSHRDYGNRVGIYRLMRVLANLGIKATALFNSAVAERYPILVADIAALDWEFAAHGVHMGALHHSEVSIEDERKLVRESVEKLRDLTRQKIRGWRSPAWSQSRMTPSLVAELGIEYMMDLSNDDLPYPYSTDSGRLIALPASYELDDAHVIDENRNPSTAFAGQIWDGFARLESEAKQGDARVLAITVHPWVSGQPHRIGAIADVLGRIAKHPAVLPMTGGELLDIYREQTSPRKTAI